MNKISGIYKITNTITGDFYIGSSKNIKKRWSDHKSISEWTRQPNSKLYQDMAQYGLNSFTFEVIEETNSLKEREQYWISYLQPNYNDRRANGHNTERYKNYNKEWKDIHKEEYLAKNKSYYNRLCLYESETLTLRTLSQRFRKIGIAHPTQEAKKYLISNVTN